MEITLNPNEYWTTEEYNKFRHLENPDSYMGMKVAKILPYEQRKKFIDTYFVKEFPANPVLGAIVNKDSIEYVYNGLEWVIVSY